MAAPQTSDIAWPGHMVYTSFLDHSSAMLKGPDNKQPSGQCAPCPEILHSKLRKDLIWEGHSSWTRHGRRCAFMTGYSFVLQYGFHSYRGRSNHTPAFTDRTANSDAYLRTWRSYGVLTGIPGWHNHLQRPKANIVMVIQWEGSKYDHKRAQARSALRYTADTAPAANKHPGLCTQEAQ